MPPSPPIDDLYRAAIGLHQQGRMAEAAALYDRVLAARPSHAGALHLKGVIALQSGDPHTARQLIERSLSIQPRHALALSNLGVAHRLLGEDRLALQRFREALAIDPDLTDALANISRVLMRLGEVAESVDYAKRALARDDSRIPLHSARLFALNYLGEVDPVESTAAARQFGALVASRIPARTAHANAPDPHRPLRVGIVSGDFRVHAVARFLIDVLPHLSPAVALYGYYTASEDDEFTERFRQTIPHFAMVENESDAALERRILADGIDILVDLSGHTASNRLTLFARKPAPVQMTWLGYFATTGLGTMDYVLANRFVVPPEEEWQWVESPWRMPDTYLCFSQPANAPAVGPLPALAAGTITFGSFNNFNKFSDATLAVWGRVLAEIPRSRLILRSSAAITDAVEAGLRTRLRAAGLPDERVRIDRRLDSYAAHLQSYDEIDIALDPFPYNGGTTTVEALYMGVPVLVKAGDRYVAHMGESILANAGLADWIAPDADAYVALAAQKAADLAALASLREQLRPRMLGSPLFDAPRFAHHLEAAWRGMWQAWCARQTSA